MNTIMRHIYLILTSKLSILKRDENGLDDPFKKKEKIDM